MVQVLRGLRLALVPAVVVLSLGLASPSLALSKSQTLDVQEKLTLLGYTPGSLDGKMGRQTKSAVRAFQKDAGIGVDGIVGPRTMAMLNEFVGKGGPQGRLPAANNQLDIYEDVLTDRLASGRVTLPTRYGQVEAVRTGAGRYSLSINGQVVASSPKGQGMPRFSRSFELPGEDVILITTPVNLKGGCKLEHTVMVIRANGTFLPPTRVGNCQPVLGGVIETDRVVFPFPPERTPSWRLEESWIYQAGNITQQ